jgi:hypothetical protein
MAKYFNSVSPFGGKFVEVNVMLGHENRFENTNFLNNLAQQF